MYCTLKKTSVCLMYNVASANHLGVCDILLIARICVPVIKIKSCTIVGTWSWLVCRWLSCWTVCNFNKLILIGRINFCQPSWNLLLHLIKFWFFYNGYEILFVLFAHYKYHMLQVFFVWARPCCITTSSSFISQNFANNIVFCCSDAPLSTWY